MGTIGYLYGASCEAIYNFFYVMMYCFVRDFQRSIT